MKEASMAQPIGLVPLDGSATSECVLPWAVTMARGLNLTLVLEKLVTEAWPGGDEKAESELRAAEHYLNGVAESLAGSGVAVEIRATPAQHDIPAAINGSAETLEVSMVLLATHGRTGPRRWVMGSVADGVVRSSTRPVLAVK